jgi:hypothetical protein
VLVQEVDAVSPEVLQHLLDDLADVVGPAVPPSVRELETELRGLPRHELARALRPRASRSRKARATQPCRRSHPDIRSVTWLGSRFVPTT